MRRRYGLLPAAVALIAMALECLGYPAQMGIAEWTAYMMGVDSPDALSTVRAAVAGCPAVKIAIANSVVVSGGGYAHDDSLQSEMQQIADYLGLAVEIIRVQPQGRGLEAIYEESVAVGDIVVDYRSYWDASSVSQALRVISGNPDKLFVLPYGEINGSDCPATSTSLQGCARHADGSGCANILNAIPLSYGFGGTLMRPLRRTAADTSTVTFVVPTAWAVNQGETCPSAAAASVASAYLYAAHANAPSAAEIVWLLSAGAGFPTPSEKAEFDSAALATLRSEIEEMTAVDSLGRRMLLNDAVINLRGALGLLMSDMDGIHARDSFENCAAGMNVASVDGWRGDGTIETESYVPPVPPGFPMTNVPHAKVLDAGGNAVRALPEGMKTGGKVDLMVCVSRATKDLESPGDDVQCEIACDSAGRMCLWHLHGEGGTWKKGWIPLSEMSYADGEWVRVGVELDYASNHDGDAFVKVTINGSLQPTVHGVRSPTDTRSYGAWHYLAKNRLAGGVSALTEFSMSGTMIDDIVFCENAVGLAHTGPTAVDGIEFSWFDKAGMPRNPLAAAPFVPGYTLGDIYTAGLDPYSDRPLEVTGFAFSASGKPHIEFNGYKGETPVGYRVLHSSTPDFKDAATFGVSDGTFAGDASSWTTTWDGLLANPGNAGFYKVEAIR